MWNKKKIAVFIAAPLVMTGLAGGILAHAQSQQLVYICSSQPCTNAQEFEVFDSYGNPIYSVGEYGGDAVFGDNRSVFAPGNVFNPAMVESYESPAKYASDHKSSASCAAPALWLAPQGMWLCSTAGTWVQYQAFPVPGQLLK